MRLGPLSTRMLGVLAIWLTGCGAFEFGTTPPDMLGQKTQDGAMGALCDPPVMGSVKTCWNFADKDTLDGNWTVIGWDNDGAHGNYDCWQKGQVNIHNSASTTSLPRDRHCSLTLNINFPMANTVVSRVIIKIEQELQKAINADPQISINMKTLPLFNEITLDTPGNPLELSFSLAAKNSASVPEGFWNIKVVEITPLCAGPAGLVKCSF